MSGVIFTSFHGSVGVTDNGWGKRQDLLHKTAVVFGRADREVKWTRNDLVQTEFYRNNREVLDEPRGGGLWVWKPWTILQTLELANDGDYVIYHDIGKPFREADPARGGLQFHGNVIELPMQSIIDWAEDNNGMFPGVNTPHYGPASQWTKRDCFVGMDCDYEAVWKLPLVQAGYNAWKKTPSVIEFLHLWLKHCCDRRLISDDSNVLGKPNLPDFSEHRHDQSILTNLIRREGVKAYGSETDATPYVRNFNYLIRRTGLDRIEAANKPTLTKKFVDNGGSKNLPVGVTSWIDLDIANRTPGNLNILCLRAESNEEESWIAEFFKEANLQTIDLSKPGSIDLADTETEIRQSENNFDWILAYGFKDQALLTYLCRLAVPSLKPMGYMIAGLDYSLHFVKDDTYDSFIKQLGHNRRLSPSINAEDQTPMRLIVGTATNPVQSKKRRGRVIIASIQAGLPANYYD